MAASGFLTANGLLIAWIAGYHGVASQTACINQLVSVGEPSLFAQRQQRADRIGAREVNLP